MKKNPFTQKRPTLSLLNKFSKKILAALFLVLTSSIGFSQCTASFTATDNGNGNYTFTNTSTGTTANTDYNWSIGTPYIYLGSSSTSFNYTFSNGTYTIILTIIDSSTSCSSTTSQAITITSGQPCNITAGFSATNGANGLVNFTSSSTGNFNTEYWDLGDGNSGIGANPSHIYNANGTYGVCVIVSDSNSFTCFDTLCLTVVISNVVTPPCNISAGFSYTNNGSGNFSFTNTSTGTTNFQWSFGDGNNSFATNPNHTFAANGTYTVVLFAYDSVINCFDYSFQTIVVTGVISSPTCNAGYTMYLDSNTNNIIVVNSSTGSNLDYFWSFGDGNTSTQAYPSYTYTTPGPFYLCLTVTDSVNSCSSTYCDSIGSNGIVLKQTGFTINIQSPIATSIDEATKNIISNWSIYPNPFKENVTIEFVLNDNSAVEIFATDLVGNTVDVISNEMMYSGINNVKWNANKLSNGIYLVTIKTENSLQVKKVVLNR